MFRADLHSHTTFSDGTLTPRELLHEAKRAGLSGMSITDHDTIEAYALAIPVAKELGILLGSGVEFSADFQGMSVHVLGYDFDLKSQAILDLCAWHQRRREARNKAILEQLKRLSIPLLEEELHALGQRTLGRPHIAYLMVQKGYVASIKEAFQHYIGDDKPCFVPGEKISVEKTIETIHRGGGKAFIAHPHLLDHGRKIKELLKLPLDGLECHYAKFPPEQEKRWVAIARERGLLISGGSDFHGSTKDYISLGCSWVDEESFHKIFQHPL